MDVRNTALTPERIGGSRRSNRLRRLGERMRLRAAAERVVNIAAAILVLVGKHWDQYGGRLQTRAAASLAWRRDVDPPLKALHVPDLYRSSDHRRCARC